MPLLTPEQMNDGNNSNTIEVGKSANVVINSYEPFQSKKGKTIPKYIATDADTGAKYELVGYSIHDCLKQLNDDITADQTVVQVKVLDNGTAYPDYEATIVAGTKDPLAAAPAPF